MNLNSSQRSIVASILLMLLAACAATRNPEPELPNLPVFNSADIDADTPACENFYQHACGGWHERHPRPPRGGAWSRTWSQYADQVDEYVRARIGASVESGARSRDEQLVGDFFAACMDTATIEARGLAPLQDEFRLIDNLQQAADLAPVLGALLVRTGLYSSESFLFHLEAGPDPVAGSQIKRLDIHAGHTLALNSRDNYTGDDEAQVAMRQEYLVIVANLLSNLGLAEADAGRQAQAILALETELARARDSGKARRNDAHARVNVISLADLQALAPGFNWQALLTELGISEIDRINIPDPDYLARVAELASEVDPETWRAFLKLRVVLNRSTLLPRTIRDAAFDLKGRLVYGLTSPQPRWQSCYWQVEQYLTGALGRLFVEDAIKPGMRETAHEVFNNIRAMMRRRIEQADWLESETRTQALVKLEAVRVSIGHPETWPDDSGITIHRDDAYGNTVRASAAHLGAELSGLGEPVALDEWTYPVTQIIGYQANPHNAIYITAAYLMLLSADDDDLAVRYGGLGRLLAHELVHGFDSLGRSYDAQGRLRNWWTDADAQRFEARTDCVADQYSAMEYPGGIPIDGDYVVSEQTAELAGARIAWEAYQAALADTADSPGADMTASRRFFLTGAQTWCMDATPQIWQYLAAHDSHALGPPAVNGIVVNLPEFGEVFGCETGQPMVKPPEAVCRVW